MELNELRALQSNLRGESVQACPESAVEACPAAPPPPLSAAHSSLPGSIAWPFASGTSTTIFDLITRLIRLDPAGLGGHGDPVPRALRHLHSSAALGCIATRADVTTTSGAACPAGVHANFALDNGVLDAPTDVYVSASLISSDAGIFTPLIVDLVVRESALPGLWSALLDALIATFPAAEAGGATRYLQQFRLTSASIRYTANSFDVRGAALTLVIASNVLCAHKTLAIPLSLFDSYVGADGRIARNRMQQVLTAFGRGPLLSALNATGMTAGGALDYDRELATRRRP